MQYKVKTQSSVGRTRARMRADTEKNAVVGQLTHQTQHCMVEVEASGAQGHKK